MTRKIESLEVVLKITERCNINCTYCYMFNHGNDDYLSHPPYIKDTTLDQTAAWIEGAIADFKIRTVTIIFHGGEPMMMKKERFDQMCTMFKERLGELTQLRFAIQTNAILVTKQWVHLFAKHRVSVGVSIDGPKQLHDAHRIDHQQRGTYDDTIRGLQMLQRAASHDLINSPGVICVIDPTKNGAEIYRHFVDDLGLDSLSFLLPMDSHDQVDPAYPARLGGYLDEILTEWKKDDNPHTIVRMFQHFLRFLSAPGDEAALRLLKGPEIVIVAVASNGDISVNDDFKSINFGQAVGNVASMPMREYLDSPVHAYLGDVWNQVPDACNECAWVGYCRGGAQNQVASNRFSVANGFNNQSVFCDALKSIYSKLAGYLIDAGYDPERLADVLYLARQDITVKTLPAPAGKYIKTIPIKILAEA